MTRGNTGGRAGCLPQVTPGDTQDPSGNDLGEEIIKQNPDLPLASLNSRMGPGKGGGDQQHQQQHQAQCSGSHSRYFLPN